MSIFQKALSNTLRVINQELLPQEAFGYTQIVNAAGQPINKYDYSAFQFIGQGNVVWLGDNLQAYIDRGYSYNDLVYSIVFRLSQKAASLPYYVKEWKNGKSTRVQDHEVLDLLWTPNPMQGQMEFFQQLFGFELVTGNSYLYGLRLDVGPNKGKATEFNVLPSQGTEIVAGGWQEPIKGYRQVYGNQEVLFTKGDVMHTKHPNLMLDNSGSQLYGMSPLRAMSRVLTKANLSTDTQAKAYQNNGPGGIISNRSDTASWSPQQQDQVQEKFNEKWSGASNAKRVIITSGDVVWQEIGMSPADLGILEDGLMTMRAMCRAYNEPSVLMGDAESSTYNNIGEARRAEWTDAILPMVNRFVDNFNRWYMRPTYSRGGVVYEICPDTSGVEELQEDKKQMAEVLDRAWWIKGSRKQELMGEEVDPAMDRYFVPSSMLPLDQLDAQMGDPFN